MKEGISAMHKNQDRPMHEYNFVPLTTRVEKHSNLHPSDSNIPNVERGVTWGKTGKGTKRLKEFYKNHIYTFVDKDMNKAWVQVAGFKEEEE